MNAYNKDLLTKTGDSIYMQHIEASNSLQSVRTPSMSTPRDEFKAKRGKSRGTENQYEGGSQSSF